MRAEWATKIMERAANGSVAVFVSGEVVKITRVTTDLFQEAMQKKADKLMGVYDQNAKHEWLMEDLEYVGI